MKILHINQILPTIDYGDAISNEVLEIKANLRKWGYQSEIFAQNIHPKLVKDVKIYKDYIKISSPKNILIFHFSTGSILSKFFMDLPDKKIIIYHNLTPPSFFVKINDTIAQLLINGKNELKQLVDKTELALGDSEFNRRELVDLGFKNTGVLPIILDFEKYKQKPNRKILNKFEEDLTNFIFVGRLAPNKKQEDIIKTFYYYNKCIDSGSRLFLVGSYTGTEKYYAQLMDLIQRLDLENIYITGKVDFNELLAYYRLADVFISMSEHEGFCVPLLECMYFGIPIIAFNSSAIPFTLDRVGILVNEKRYEEVAELINIVIRDNKFKSRILEKQQERLKDFEKSIVIKKLKEFIEEVTT